MATIVQCSCGAEYRRTEEKFLAPHTGDAVCTVCGAALESWWKSTHVPTYELIERPTESSSEVRPPQFAASFIRLRLVRLTVYGVSLYLLPPIPYGLFKKKSRLSRADSAYWSIESMIA
jgi:hypothetical protein